MAQIDRAVSLLKSNDEIDNRNGCALVINAAATASNISDIINQGCIPLIVRRMSSHSDDLKMKCCWAINNLCVHDNGREAVHRAGVVNHFPQILQSQDPETIKKACWAITNLARHPQAAQEIVRSGCFAGLVKVLTTGDPETKSAALQPLCNLVLDPDHQLSFLHAQGLRPVIGLLSSNDDRTKELAVTLVSFITTNHDQVREELLSLAVLRPLNKILNGEGTQKMQELTLNTLVNLSLSDVAEEAILNQGSVSAVVGLLSSPVLQLQTQAAMLLSNLLGNPAIRTHIRYLGWMDPLFSIIASAPTASVQQALRCIVNITFDNHCRYMLTRSGAEQKLRSANSRCGDSQVSSLVDTATKNFGVPVASDVQREVDEALRSGKVQSVAAPSARKAQATNDFAGLDELLGGSSSPAPKPAAYKPPAASKPVQSHSQGFDDLDALLGGSSAPAPKPAAYKSPAASKPVQSQGFDDLDDLLNTNSYNSPAPPAPKPAASKPASKPVQSQGFDDLDELLGDMQISQPPKSHHHAPPPSNNSFGDLDDLLSDIPPPKASKSVASKPPPSNNFGGLDDLDSLLGDLSAPAPQKKQSSYQQHHDDGFDDIDSLLNDMAPAQGHKHRGGDDDIDSLLLDLDAGHGSRGGRGGHGGHDNQSIDDLLADLGTPSHHHSHGHDAIDDLLNDLTR